MTNNQLQQVGIFLINAYLSKTLLNNSDVTVTTNFVQSFNMPLCIPIH